MIETYEAIKDLLDEKLNGDDDVIFDVTLFNSGKISYTNKVSVTGTYNVQERQVTPAHITEINSRYINIPNTNALEANIGIEFDIFTRDYLTLNKYEDQAKYQSVSYNNTLLAINEMQRDLLAQKFTLGDSGVYFGGTDSEASIQYATAFEFNTIYLKIDLKNNFVEELLFADDISRPMTISKTSTDIVFEVGSSVSLSVPYEIGVNEIVVYYDGLDSWNLYINGETDSQADATGQSSYDEITFSSNDGFDGILYQVIVDDAIISSGDVTDVEETVSPALINIADNTSRYEFNQNGSYILTTNEITNCVLWGSLGNIVFSFEGLIPIGDMFFNDEGYPRQMFYLNIPCLISNDLMFGNDTEYFIDDVQVFPVDRGVSYGTQIGTTSNINGTTSTSIIEENARDFSTTFYYKPSRKINEIFKHIVSNSNEQNKDFELEIRYPFYKETYDVLIDTGGSSNNVNEMHTFTVTYKNIDSSVK